MTTGLRRVALFVVLAVTASLLTLTPPALAEEQRPGAAPAPGLAEVQAAPPEVAKPEIINRTPTGFGDPATIGEAGLDSNLGGITAAGEVIERRTEDSTTVVTEDGSYETTFFDSPINYRNTSGQLVPIDSALVPAGRPGVALRNAAGPVALSLPAAMGSGPVTAAKGDTSVAFALRGATGAPSPGVSKTLPAEAREQLSDEATKASATYAGAVPGVDVTYTAMPEGVKEDIVLAGPDSPTSFHFTVEASKGLTATETPAGGIDFVDGAGEAKASFAPPFAYDADFEATGAEASFTEDAVSLRIVETTPQLVVRLAADPAWLAAPERAWPVVIDPVLTFEGATADTYLRKASPDENNGMDSRLYVSSGSLPRRTMHAKSIQNFFDEPATLYSATLRLYATTDSSSYSPRPLGAYRADTTGWHSGQATWNSRLTGEAWKTPGGDFRPEPLFTNPEVTGTPGWRSWPITSAAQDWLDGEANVGVLLKYDDESAGGTSMYFASSNEADTTLRPRIVVRWEPLEGVRAPYTHEKFDLGTVGKASVNVASGNLSVTGNDLSIAGTGLDATVDRRYHSRGIYSGSVGARWRMWPQSEERLYYADFNDAYARNGDVMWHGGPEELLVFSKRADGTYTSPPGYQATLSLVTEAGAQVFKLSDHDRATVRSFYGSGYLRDVADASGNKITFSYTCDTAANECYMVSMTDTQGRVTTFERSAAGQAGQYKVTKMTDPAGLVHRYAYDRADAQANLASYTDPAGKVTRYDYTGSVLGLMSKVTDPGGNATAFTYDDRSRVTSLTRAGQIWRFDYSTPWQTKMTDPQGQLTTYSFDRRGVVTRTLGPPSAPTGLHAVPGDGQAALSWDASTPNGSPVSGYTLTASPSGATTTVAGDATSAMFSGLTNGTAYTFTAVATNAVGNSRASLPSNEVTPRADRSLLSPLVDPTNVVATRGDTTATVTWDRPLVTLPLLTTFEVTTYRASDGIKLGTTSAGTDSSVTVTGLKNGTPVYFTVTAQSLLLSGTSEPSNTITPAGPPFAPTDVVATRGDGKVNLTWRAPDPRPDGTPGDNGDPITSYTVTAFRADNNAEVRTIEGAVSPLEITDLTNGTTYYFKVRATNGVGTGPDSPSSNYVTPAGPPFPPTNVVATLGAPGQAEVTWTAPNDNGSPITSYTVTASPGEASQTVQAPMTSATVGGLQEGTSYTFTVVASNDVDDSGPSAPSNALVVARPPSTPTNVTAVARDGAAALNWNASLSNGARVTYTVTASSGGASRSTMGTSTVVDGLTNGVEYTFTVQAFNSAGASESSAPSNPVTPRAYTPPSPPPDSPCLDSPLPPPPEEVYLPSGAVQRQIIVPCRSEMGRVRMGFFIEDEEVQAVPGVRVVTDGDGRSFDPNMGPDDNRIYLEIDYSTGTGFIQSNRSCTNKTESDCNPANSLKDAFESYVRADGSVFIDFAIGNSLVDSPLKISADLDVLPVPGGLVCVTGAISQFPAFEAYYDQGGDTAVKHQLPQSDYGFYALAFPDRDLPPCLSREMP